MPFLITGSSSGRPGARVPERCAISPGCPQQLCVRLFLNYPRRGQVPLLGRGPGPSPLPACSHFELALTTGDGLRPLLPAAFLRM